MSTTSPSGRSRFWMWPRGAEAPVEFAPAERLASSSNTDVRYFLGVAAALEQLLGQDGQRVLFTWELDRFSAELEGSVAILIGDEMHQLPSYLGSLRALFKTGGRSPDPLRHTLGLDPAVAWRTLVRDARDHALARRRGSPDAQGTAVFELPIGYFGLTDVPFVAFEQRSTDVFFAGSVESRRGFTIRPRLVARRQMLQALERVGAEQPELRIECLRSGPFANPGGMLEAEHYSHRLMQARVALCPRGNINETFRLVEAAACGCVAVCERLPERWYHHDCPAVQLSRWSELPAVLCRLTADPEGLAARGRQMLDWWRSSLCERTVAHFIARALAEI